MRTRKTLFLGALVFCVSVAEIRRWVVWRGKALQRNLTPLGSQALAMTLVARFGKSHKAKQQALCWIVCLVFFVLLLFWFFKPGHLFWCLNGSRTPLKIESRVSLSCISSRWWIASTALFYYKLSLIYSLAWLFSLYCFFSETAEAELLLSLSSSFSHTTLLISCFTVCFVGLPKKVLWLKGRRRKGQSLLNRVKRCEILRLQISLCALNCACCSCCKCWRSDKVWPRCLHYPLALLVSGQSINCHTTYRCSVNWHRWSQGNLKCSVHQTSSFCGWVVWFPVNNSKCVESA